MRDPLRDSLRVLLGFLQGFLYRVPRGLSSLGLKGSLQGIL